MIIVDDGSHDPITIEVLEYYEQEPRIKVYRLIHNYGHPSYPRNYGITVAKGDFIGFMDDDDINYLNRIEDSLEVFREHPEVDAVVSNFALLNFDGELIDYDSV